MNERERAWAGNVPKSPTTRACTTGSRQSKDSSGETETLNQTIVTIDGNEAELELEVSTSGSRGRSSNR